MQVLLGQEFRVALALRVSVTRRAELVLDPAVSVLRRCGVSGDGVSRVYSSHHPVRHRSHQKYSVTSV